MNIKGTELSLSLAELSSTALTIPESLTDHQVGMIGESLARIDGCLGWWWGDYFLTLKERGSPVTIAEFASVRGLSESTMHVYRQTSEFYPSHARNAQLSWTHHCECWRAMVAPRDLSMACDWLDRAVTEGWSVGALRKAIKAEQGEGESGGLRGRTSAFSPLLDADRWAGTKLGDVEAMPVNAAHALLEDIPHLDKLLALLRERVQEPEDDSGIIDLERN